MMDVLILYSVTTGWCLRLTRSPYRLANEVMCRRTRQTRLTDGASASALVFAVLIRTSSDHV